MTRLSEDTRLEILKAYLAGEKMTAIADRFGVDKCYPRILAYRRGLPGRPRPAECNNALPKARAISISNRSAAAAARAAELAARKLTPEQRAKAGLDDLAIACFDRCVAGGLTLRMARNLSLDDMAIRARVAARKGMQ